MNCGNLPMCSLGLTIRILYVFQILCSFIVAITNHHFRLAHSQILGSRLFLFRGSNINNVMYMFLLAGHFFAGIGPLSQRVFPQRKAESVDDRGQVGARS